MRSDFLRWVPLPALLVVACQSSPSVAPPVASQPASRAASVRPGINTDYLDEGKNYLTISFGCTGGHHRSVMIADEIAKRLAAAGYRVKENHRDIKK